MSIQNPISDMLTRIRNAQAVGKKTVNMPKSKLKIAIAKVLKEEGYILGYEECFQENKPWLSLQLKYFQGRPVIDRLESVSCPSLRVYKSRKLLPIVANGLGISIVSTSQGVMTAVQAKRLGQGGEILCYVS